MEGGPKWEEHLHAVLSPLVQACRKYFKISISSILPIKSVRCGPYHESTTKDTVTCDVLKAVLQIWHDEQDEESHQVKRGGGGGRGGFQERGGNTASSHLAVHDCLGHGQQDGLADSPHICKCVLAQLLVEVVICLLQFAYGSNVRHISTES